MKKVKLLITTLMISALVYTSIFAAVSSPTPRKLTPENTKITPLTVEYTYTGQEQTVDLVVKYEGHTIKIGQDYVATLPKVKEVGRHTFDVTVQGIGVYQGSVTSSVTVMVKEPETTVPATTKPETTKPVITTPASTTKSIETTGQFAKQNQALKNTKKRKVKYKKVKRKKVKVKLKVRSTGDGKIQYKRLKKKSKKYKKMIKKMKVSKKGVVTFKKGARKGTYYVIARATETPNFYATAWKKIKIRIK